MRRLTVAVLVLGVGVAPQKLRAKRTEVDTTQSDSVPEMTEAIYARLVTQWDAWKNRDAASNNAVIADDSQTVSANGLLRTGKPAAQQMAEQPITRVTNCPSFASCRSARIRPWPPTSQTSKPPARLLSFEWSWEKYG